MKTKLLYIIICFVSLFDYPCKATAASNGDSHWNIYITPNYPIIENTGSGTKEIPDGYYELEAEIDLDYESTDHATYYYDIMIDLWVQPVPDGKYIKLLDDGMNFTLQHVGKGKSRQTFKLPWGYVRKAQEIMGKDMSDWTILNKIYFTSRDSKNDINLNNPNINKVERPGFFYISMSKLKGRIPSFGVLADEFASPFGDAGTGIRLEYHFFDRSESKWSGKYTECLGIGLQFSRTPDFNAEDIVKFPSIGKAVSSSTYSPQYFTAAPHPEFGVMPKFNKYDNIYTSIANIRKHPVSTFLNIFDSDIFFKNLGNLLDTDEVYVRMIAWLPELNKTGVVGSDEMIPDIPFQQISVNTVRLFLDRNGYWQIDKKNKISWIDSRPVDYNLKFPTLKYWEGKYARWYREDGISRYKPVRNRPIWHRRKNTGQGGISEAGNDGQGTSASEGNDDNDNGLISGSVGERQDDLPPEAITKLDVYQFAIPVGDDILGIQATRCGRGKNGDDDMVEIEYEITNLNSHIVQLSLLVDSDSTRFATAQGELLSEIYSGVAPKYEMRKGKVDITLQPDSCVKVRNSAVDNLFWAGERINVLIPVKIGNNVGYIPLRNMFVSQNEGLEKYEQELFDEKISAQLTGLSYGGEIWVNWSVINNTPRPIALRVIPEHCSLTVSDGSQFTTSNGFKINHGTSDVLILNPDGTVHDKSDYKDIIYIRPYDRILGDVMTTEAGEDATSFTLTLELSDGTDTQQVVFRDVPITYTGYTFNPDEDVEYEE